jgi:hypothetical protein
LPSLLSLIGGTSYSSTWLTKQAGDLPGLIFEQKKLNGERHGDR